MQCLLEHHRELVDAAFVLNEGGGGVIRDGKRVLNAVQAAEKVYQSYSLEVTNPGGHSSLPRSDNAIYRLSKALLAVADDQLPVALNEVTRASLRDGLPERKVESVRQAAAPRSARGSETRQWRQPP